MKICPLFLLKQYCYSDMGWLKFLWYFQIQIIARCTSYRSGTSGWDRQVKIWKLTSTLFFQFSPLTQHPLEPATLYFPHPEASNFSCSKVTMDHVLRNCLTRWSWDLTTFEFEPVSCFPDTWSRAPTLFPGDCWDSGADREIWKLSQGEASVVPGTAVSGKVSWIENNR